MITIAALQIYWGSVKKQKFIKKNASANDKNLQDNGIFPPIMENYFILRENTHNVRKFQEISNENRKTVKHRIKVISDRTPFLWENLPN